MSRRCAVLSSLLLAGCAFRSSGTADVATDDDLPTDASPTADADPRAPDAGPPIVLRIDSQAEFLALGAGVSTASLTDATVGDGFVEPRAWAVGALDVRGANTRLFNDATPLADVWSTLRAAELNGAVAGRALADLTNRDYGQGVPGGVGITANNPAWTVWADGEVFLEAGAHTFSLTGDGSGFLAIATAGDANGDGSLDDGEFVSVASDDVAALLTVTVASTGWWPVRYALSDGNDVARSRVLLGPPGAAPTIPLSPWRLRTRTDGRTGLIRHASVAKDLAITVDPSLLASDALEEDYVAGAPADLAGSTNDWSQRLAGQVWIETAGAYTFALHADDGYRLRVDDAVSAAWASGVHDATLDVTLSRGWHDLRVEHQENGGDAAISLSISAAPLPADVGPLPLARLRPVITGRDRIATVATRLASTGNGDHPLALGMPDDAVPVDYAIGLDAETFAWSDLDIRIVPPWSAGASTLLYDNGLDSGRKVRTYPLGPDALPPLGGAALDGTWILRVDDDFPNASPTTLNAWGVTTRFTGGPAAIAPTSSWWSSVREVADGAPVVVTAISLTSVTPAGTTAAAQVRLCDDPACDGEGNDAWFDPATTPPAAQAPGAYAQLRVDLASDGIAAPLVDALEITFTRAP